MAKEVNFIDNAMTQVKEATNITQSVLLPIGEKIITTGIIFLSLEKERRRHKNR